MNCPEQISDKSTHSGSENQILNDHYVIKSGFFFRSSDKACIQRFFCKSCNLHFSTETKSLYKFQKKRMVNQGVFENLSSAMSQRRCAKRLRINRKTVVRKFLFYGLRCQYLVDNMLHIKNKEAVTSIQFDDVESFEHTKLKPLSITMAVQEKTRLILGFKMAEMPAKGHLVQKSKQKYGLRVDERYLKRNQLFQVLKCELKNVTHILSDQNPHYTKDVKRHFPNAVHKTTKGQRGCVTGQGELKAVGFDPLFSFNHTAAMLRANINRLLRRTWCTTKIAQRLSLHLAIYTIYHNQELLKKTQLQL